METGKPAKQSTAIVLVGDFNPVIYQPIWFAQQALIPQDEAERAIINVVHREIVNFNLDWCKIEATRERFAVATSQESAYELIRDLVVGTFSLLIHTPVRMVGLNTEMHFKMQSEEKWHKFGHQIAPKTFWEKELKDPGTRKLIIEGKRPDDFNGYIRVEVAPSVKIHPGVLFSVNDHFQVRDFEKTTGCSEIVETIKSQWYESQNRSQRIISEALKEI